MSSSTHTHNTETQSSTARLLSLAIAGTICLMVATFAGYGLWYLLEGRPESAAFNQETTKLVSDAQPNSQVSKTSTPAATHATFDSVHTPTGTVAVTAAEVVLGGDAHTPLQRILVDNFYIAETEVTNKEYSEFVAETDHSAPENWSDSEFESGEALYPVTNVRWQDAVDYCRWLSIKRGATIRLPSEAEWELAARGHERFAFPWGQAWDERAVASAATNGKVQQVKSYPRGRSPVGAYDMAGNVWEWVAGETQAEDGTTEKVNNLKLRIAKGGAANEPESKISATSRQQILEDKKFHTLGFRYVIQPLSFGSRL